MVATMVSAFACFIPRKLGGRWVPFCMFTRLPKK